MKKLVILLLMFLLTAAFCFSTDPTGQTDPTEGFWLSVDDKTGKVTAGWHIYAEGGRLFGKILSMADYPRDVLALRCRDSYSGFPLAGKVSQMPVIGTPWIFGLTLNKPGEWGGGSVVNPEDGSMYKCKIFYRKADGRKFRTDVLEMRGEIGLGIGRSQYWQKTDERTAVSLGPE